MRKAPTQKTLKKLFSLSGNHCAFPDCNVGLVNDRGTLVGQVCHIEAADGGQRDNPSLTDDQRRNFNNLIILCANHHIETNDEQTYTVSVLKEMKKNHETRFKDNQYQATQQVLEQVKRQFFSQSNMNSSSGKQENYQSATMVVNQGMTTTEVVSLIRELYDANFPKLMDAAKAEAFKNIAAFEVKFREEVSKKLSPEELAHFSNPDVQVSLYEAVQTAARKDSESLRQMLADLVISRVKSQGNELKQKVLNEAILTVSKLTGDQLKILSLCFLLKHASFLKTSHWQAFKLTLTKRIHPFLGFKGTRAEIFHLQYAGCGKVEEVFSSDLADVFRQNYSYSFSDSLTEEDITNLALNIAVSQKLLVRDLDGIHFYANHKPDLEEKMRELGLDDEVSGKILALYEKKLWKAYYVRKKLEAELPWTTELFDRYQNTGLNHLTLTSVGMAIAIAYIEQTSGMKLDIDIWIN